MAAKKKAAQAKDPTEPIREAAAAFPDVAEGTSCTQGSFKVGKKAFLYIGPQGGRYKAMFKLDASQAQAQKLAAERPDDFQAGSWVTARFSADKPLPKRLWTKWLRESHAIASGAATPKKKAAKKKAKKKAKKRAARRR